MSDNRLIIRTILEDQYEIAEFSGGLEAQKPLPKQSTGHADCAIRHTLHP